MSYLGACLVLEMLTSNRLLGLLSSSHNSESARQDLVSHEIPSEHHHTHEMFPTVQRQNFDEALKKFKRKEAAIQDGNVLMVDQLWLWVVDESTIVTFFPKKEAVSSEGTLYQQGDLHNDIYNEINSGLESVPDADKFAALIVQRAVTILLDRTAHRHLQILRIYEESLSILVRCCDAQRGSSAKLDLTDREDDTVLQVIQQGRI